MFNNHVLWNVCRQAQLSDCGELMLVYVYQNDYNKHCHLLYGDLKSTAKHDYETTPHLFQLIEGDGLDIQVLNTINFSLNCQLLTLS